MPDTSPEEAFELEQLADEALERAFPDRSDEDLPNDPPEGPEWWEIT